MGYIILPKRVNHIKAKGANSTWPKGSKFSGFSIDKDSIIDLNEVYIPTVEDILNEREECKYMRYIDSIYMAMPQEILTHILIQKGTSLLMTEIVEEYLENKEMYHEILKKRDNGN